MGALRETQPIKYGRVVELVDSLDSGSSVHCGRAGSSPASPTRKKTRYSLRIPGFFCVYKAFSPVNVVILCCVKKLFPLCFPLCAYRVNKPLHSVGTVLFHLLRDMTINIQSECCGCVSKIFLYGLDVVTGPK